LPIDYDKIRHANIKEYGEGTRHLEFFNLLYSDRTHFVYELLQNAEDAKATKVQFKLTQEKLEVLHDGRPFNENDVIGICGIDIGTKKEDLTQIGKFGIGFKSVYVYTASPEIHSGSEHFKIENYVRPSQVKPKTIGEGWTTLFDLQLNASGLDRNKACKDIAARLGGLSAVTLLFLKNIKKIAYELPNGDNGFYQRQEKAGVYGKEVTVVGKNQDKHSEDSWMIFEKPIKTNGDIKQVAVEIAFRVQHNPETESLKIIKSNNSPLSVYFPTEKETHLGFLIQGPYRTTPSRDNIPKDDKWNTRLIKETAAFAVDCLQMLKEMKLLTVEALNILPIRNDDFPRESMFYPFFEEIKNAFINLDLLPTSDNTYASAKQVKLARGAELKSLLNQEQLKALFHSNDDIKWLPDGITQDKTPDLKNYLTRTLDVEEITPENFAKRVTSTFFAKQSDEWIIKFYRFIGDRKDLWRSGREYGVTTGPLYNKDFIRLHNGSHVRPFNNYGDPNAFISDGSNLRTNHPVVKLSISSDAEAKRFLNELGIPDLDIVEEVIESLLPKYYGSVPDAEHWEDMELIKRAWDTDSQQKKRRLKKALQETPFILASMPGKDNAKYIKPTQAYFFTDDLIYYFDSYSQVGFVVPEYDEDSLAMFKDLGVSETVRVNKRNKNPKGYIIISNISGQHERGVDGFDPDIEVEGLTHALNNPTPERSEYIWNNIALTNTNCIFGTVEKSNRQTYANATTEKRYSTFGKLLVERSWLPKKNSGFTQPRDLSLDELPKTYQKDGQLADKLGMKKDASIKLADEVGVSLENIDLLKKYPAEFEKWKAEMLKKESAACPEKTAAGPPVNQGEKPATENYDQVEKAVEIDSASTASDHNRMKEELTAEQAYDEQFGDGYDQSATINKRLNDSELDTSNSSGTDLDHQKDSVSIPEAPAGTKLKSTSQRRLLSYVSPGSLDADGEGMEPEKDSHQLHVGEAAVRVVIEHEITNGRKVKSMPHINPGYDIISEIEGEVRYIEVKGLEGTWGERGVMLSSTQFFYTKEHRNHNYWLYVVENVFSQTPQIHKIRNPAEKVDYFAFDSGWSQVADSAMAQSGKRRNPAPGDEVLLNGNVVGTVESVLSSGEVPLVTYRTKDGRLVKKLQKELCFRPRRD